MSIQPLEIGACADIGEFTQGQESLRHMYEKVFESVLSGGFCCELSNSVAKYKQFCVATKSPEGVFRALVTKTWWKVGRVRVEDNIQIERKDVKGKIQTLELDRENQEPWYYKNSLKGDNVGKRSEQEREVFINSFLYSEVDTAETEKWFNEAVNEPRIGNGIRSITWVNRI